MKIAIYPGSFNPWHEGHADILNKALMVFDKVIVAQGINSDKEVPEILYLQGYDERVDVVHFTGTLKEYLDDRKDISVIVKGLRNGNDLIYEMTQQYWNEDLGIEIPTAYFASDRVLTHISSSAIRQLRKSQVFRR